MTIEIKTLTSTDLAHYALATAVTGKPTVEFNLRPGEGGQISYFEPGNSKITQFIRSGEVRFFLVESTNERFEAIGS